MRRSLILSLVLLLVSNIAVDAQLLRQEKTRRSPVAEAPRPETSVSESSEVLSGFGFRRQRVSLQYSSYLGGREEDWPWDIAVDAAGHMYIVGDTRSADFPATSTVLPGGSDFFPDTSDAFVTKVSRDGRTLEWSVVFGGLHSEGARAVALDQQGNVVVVGWTETPELFPTTQPRLGGPWPPVAGDYYDVFIVKFDPDGNLLFSTLLGGSKSDLGWGIAVQSNGSIIVGGITNSVDFPTTRRSIQKKLAGEASDAFVTAVASDGSSILWSTYLGGTSTDNGLALARDSWDNVIVVGWTFSSNFPVTTSAFQTPKPSGDCLFVSRISSDGSALLYSSFLGGNRPEFGHSVSVDSGGLIYVTGQTESSNFPTTSGSIQPAFPAGVWNATFVAKINPHLSGSASLVYSTFLGGGFGAAVASDRDGNAYVTGSGIVPITPDAYDGSLKHGYLVKLNASGNAVLYGTYFGGSELAAGYATTLDPRGNIYLAGVTWAADHPTTPDAFDTTCGADGFCDQDWSGPKADAWFARFSVWPGYRTKPGVPHAGRCCQRGIKTRFTESGIPNPALIRKHR